MEARNVKTLHHPKKGKLNETVFDGGAVGGEGEE